MSPVSSGCSGCANPRSPPTRTGHKGARDKAAAGAGVQLQGGSGRAAGGGGADGAAAEMGAARVRVGRGSAARMRRHQDNAAPTVCKREEEPQPGRRLTEPSGCSSASPAAPAPDAPSRAMAASRPRSCRLSGRRVPSQRPIVAQACASSSAASSRGAPTQGGRGQRRCGAPASRLKRACASTQAKQSACRGSPQPSAAPGRLEPKQTGQCGRMRKRAWRVSMGVDPS